MKGRIDSFAPENPPSAPNSLSLLPVTARSVTPPAPDLRPPKPLQTACVADRSSARVFESGVRG